MVKHFYIAIYVTVRHELCDSHTYIM